MQNQANRPETTMKPKIDVKDTTPTTCDECGGEAFQEAFILRRVSAILSGTGQEGFMPVQVFACFKCGNVNQGFLPPELRSPVISS